MKNIVLGARIGLGLLFILFGVNYFIPFLPAQESTAEGGALLGAFFTAGYMFPLIKITEIVGGALVLLGLVPIGLILLAPVVVNIFLFHFFLAPGAGLILPIVIVALMFFLAWAFRERFQPLFTR